MTLLCDTLTEEGVKYATKEGICGYGSSGTTSPQGTSYGNCGTSYIDITNVGWGNVGLYFGATSTQGWILSYRLDAFWDGTAQNGVITRTGYAATSTISFAGVAANVGSGLFETWLTGWAVTPLGTCAVAGATDYALI